MTVSRDTIVQRYMVLLKSLLKDKTHAADHWCIHPFKIRNVHLKKTSLLLSREQGEVREGVTKLNLEIAIGVPLYEMLVFLYYSIFKVTEGERSEPVSALSVFSRGLCNISKGAVPAKSGTEHFEMDLQLVLFPEGICLLQLAGRN